MSYKYDVTMVCELKAYKHIQNSLKIDTFKNMIPEIKQINSIFILKWESIVLSEVNLLQKRVVDVLNEKKETGYAYKFFFFGESDDDIITEENELAWDTLSDFYVTRDIHIPE